MRETVYLNQDYEANQKINDILYNTIGLHLILVITMLVLVETQVL